MTKKAATPKGAVPREGKLNPKQLRFVDEYLVDMNATQAAIRAGYSAKTASSQGFDLLRKPEIVAALDAQRKQLAAATGITRDRIIRELASIAFADVRQLFNANGGMHSPVDLPDSLAPAIASIDLASFTPPGEDAVTEYTKKVKLWDKPRALERLLVHLGLDQDKAPAAQEGPDLAGIEAWAQALAKRHGVAI